MLFRALVDAGVERFAVGVQTQAQDSEARQRIAALLPHLGHLLPRGQTDLNGPDELGNVVRMDLCGGLGIETAQDAVQVIRAIFFYALTQPFAQFFRTLGTGKETIQQSAKIEPSTSNHNRQVPTGFNFGKSLPRQTRILARGNVACGVYKIEQMMRNAGSLGGAWFRGTDLEFAIHRDRIAIHHLATKALCEGHGKRCFPAGGWT